MYNILYIVHEVLNCGLQHTPGVVWVCLSLLTALFRLALPKCKGQGAVYSVDILLLHRTQLVPLIIGVDPTPSFASSPVAKECLDLLSGQSGPDNFVSL